MRSVSGPKSAGDQPEELALSGSSGSDLMGLLTQALSGENGEGQANIPPAQQARGQAAQQARGQADTSGGLPLVGVPHQSIRGPSVLPPVPLDQKDMLKRFTEIVGKS